MLSKIVPTRVDNKNRYATQEPSQAVFEKYDSSICKNITWILVFQILSLVIGLLAFGLDFGAVQLDRQWTQELTKNKIDTILAEISTKSDTMREHDGRTQTITELTDRDQTTPFVALILLGLIDGILLVHVICYYFYTPDSYRITFGRLLNIFFVMMNVAILVIIVDSMLRLNENYDKLQELYETSPTRTENPRYFLYFHQCALDRNYTSRRELEKEIKEEKVCQDTDTKIVILVLCGLNILLHGGVAVVTRSKKMILADRIDHAPDLLYDTYDTKYIRINLTFDELHAASGQKVVGPDAPKSVNHLGVPMDQEEIKFGNMVFEVSGGEVVDNPHQPGPTMPELEPVDLKIQRLYAASQKKDFEKRRDSEENKDQSKNKDKKEPNSPNKRK